MELTKRVSKQEALLLEVLARSEWASGAPMEGSLSSGPTAPLLRNLEKDKAFQEDDGDFSDAIVGMDVEVVHPGLVQASAAAFPPIRAPAITLNPAASSSIPACLSHSKNEEKYVLITGSDPIIKYLWYLTQRKLQGIVIGR